jgi:vacuolar-type H+-ATPase subunit E/Vma4
MKTYLQMDGDQLVEYVEKREYDGLSLLAHELATLRADDMATINDLRKQLQDAVKRMEEVPLGQLRYLYDNSRTINGGVKAVRSRLIQAAKGEQP